MLCDSCYAYSNKSGHQARMISFSKNEMESELVTGGLALGFVSLSLIGTLSRLTDAPHVAHRVKATIGLKNPANKRYFLIEPDVLGADKSPFVVAKLPACIGETLVDEF